MEDYKDSIKIYIKRDEDEAKEDWSDAIVYLESTKKRIYLNGTPKRADIVNAIDKLLADSGLEWEKQI